MLRKGRYDPLRRVVQMTLVLNVSMFASVASERRLGCMHWHLASTFVLVEVVVPITDKSQLAKCYRKRLDAVAASVLDVTCLERLRVKVRVPDEDGQNRIEQQRVTKISPFLRERTI